MYREVKVSVGNRHSDNTVYLAIDDAGVDLSIEQAVQLTELILRAVKRVQYHDNIPGLFIRTFNERE